MKKRRLLIFLSFIMVVGCGRQLRPGAINQADQGMFDTLYFTQVFIEDVRPKVEPCSSANTHPECGVFNSKAVEYNLIIEAYNTGNTAYQDWRAGILGGQSMELSVVQATVGLIIDAIQVDNILFQLFSAIRN
jgi:hypothetical protein